MESCAAKGCRNSRQLVGGLPRSSIERPRRKGQFLEPKYRISGGQFPCGASSRSSGTVAVFPDGNNKPEHHEYAPIFGPIQRYTNKRFAWFGNNRQVVHRLFAPIRCLLGARFLGPHSQYRSANLYAAQASAADLENVRLSEQAELAVDYYELRAQDSLKQVLDSTVIAYQETFDLTQSQYRAGLTSDEAVAEAEAQLKAAQAQDTSLGILRAQYEHAIAVLTGQPPATFSLPPETLQSAVPLTPVGVPSELLERRPDIAAAERTLAQANAQIGIAKAAYYPNITLSASGGFGTSMIANWFTWPSRFWSVGPSLAETIFDAGLRRATVQQFQANYDQTVANYRETVLTAFQQVEDNLASLRILSQAIEQQDDAVNAAARSLREATVRYKAGVDPYLNVIVAQTTLLNDQQIAVNFREQQLVASVQLIKALGGGWASSQIPSSKEIRSQTSATP